MKSIFMIALMFLANTSHAGGISIECATGDLVPNFEIQAKFDSQSKVLVETQLEKDSFGRIVKRSEDIVLSLNLACGIKTNASECKVKEKSDSNGYYYFSAKCPNVFAQVELISDAGESIIDFRCEGPSIPTKYQHLVYQPCKFHN